jgi:bleomycin hydrolase
MVTRLVKSAFWGVMAGLLWVSALAAQADSSVYQFEVIYDNAATPVKNQSYTGTCWSFATSSFLESELLRQGKGEYDLSEMFIVKNIYPEKAVNYVRLHGNTTLGPGSLSGDMMRAAAKYGVVPEAVYAGMNAGYSKHNHAEMDAVLKAMLDAVVANPGKQLSTVWLDAVKGVLDAYLGKSPETFEYKGKTYTPKSFAEHLGIRPNDYIQLTSFTHHPFYTRFALEIPDNWARNQYDNVPLDELMATIDNALAKGYTVAWDGDVSEKTFSNKEGIAILPETDWDDMTKAERDSVFKKVLPELQVTQEIRQAFFDNYRTTDDHLMHITGLAKDQNGTKYYITKNSWGTKDFKKGGYVYMSEAYVRAKTISIMVHRDALPLSIGKKLAVR